MHPFYTRSMSLVTKYILSIISVVFIGLGSYAQQLPRMKFTLLTPEDGLSHTRIWKMIQDKQGFIWLATDYGLNKYDGYKFSVYKNNEKNQNSIAENFIWNIAADPSGNIWVATNGGGLDLFDIKKEVFIHHKHDPKNSNSIADNEVRSVFVDNSGLVWLGCGITGGLIDCFNPRTQQFTHFKLPLLEKGDKQQRVNFTTEDSKGQMWFGLSSGGFYIFNKVT